MAMQNPTESRLAVAGKMIRSAMADAARGPLIASLDIIKLADNWDRWRSEADGKSCSQWLVSLLGNKQHNEAFFRRRFAAVKRIGEHSRRCWDHNAAVWASQNIGDDIALRRLDAKVLETSRSANEQPQCLSTVKRLARELGLTVATGKKPRACSKCRKLEELLKSHGIEVPE